MNPSNLEFRLKKWLREFKKGNLELYILSFIKCTPSYGAQLCKSLNNLTNGDLNLRPGTIYPILKRLENEGLIRSRIVDADEGEKGPARKLYNLTKSGEILVNKMVTKWLDNLNVMFKIIRGDLLTFKEIFDLLDKP
ncbi:MAG: PadR family transcriptional regulator [Candidatus Odinarchaeia archaeon]